MREKAWAEACKRSEAYKDQLQRDRLPGSLSSSAIGPKPNSQKKRRISVPTEMASSQVRRIKRRKSGQFTQPLTDEALAQRLQEVRAVRRPAVRVSCGFVEL